MNALTSFLIEDGLKLGLAVLLGGAVGLEREASDKPAGLRTHILICLGSALMMILSIRVAQDFAVTAADPGRIAQGVITGIGFLGAGTILHSRGGVTGLTTAATTWAVAGVGLALGSGFYLLAAAAAILILAVLWVLGRAAHDRPNGKGRATFRVVCDGPADGLKAVREAIESRRCPIGAWSYRRLHDGHCVVVECTAPRDAVPSLGERLAALPGVRSVRSL